MTLDVRSIKRLCNNNKQCGRRVRPTKYAPPASILDLWPFDHETGVRVASKVRNLPSKFGHARLLRSRIIRYVRDRRTEGLTDGQKQRFRPLSYCRGIIINKEIVSWMVYGRSLMTPLNCLWMIVYIFGDNIMCVQNEAVHSINALNNWFICNKLSLNLSKTYYMTFVC